VSVELDRRELLKALALLPFTTLQLPAAHPNRPVFFKADEFSILDILTEMIIPADEHSPGAHEAGVASYIDWLTAQEIDPDAKTSWTKGLKAVNDLSEELFQKSFSSVSAEQRTEILNRFAGTKDQPTAEQAQFWGQLKDTTAFLYYSSSIGIHEEMNYKGNVILEQFVGYDAT